MAQVKTSLISIKIGAISELTSYGAWTINFITIVIDTLALEARSFDTSQNFCSSLIFAWDYSISVSPFLDLCSVLVLLANIRLGRKKGSSLLPYTVIVLLYMPLIKEFKRSSPWCERARFGDLKCFTQVFSGVA